MKQIKTLLVLIMLIGIIKSESNKEIPKFTFVEINPSALDVMIHAFDQVLVYFHHHQNINDLQIVLQKQQSILNQFKQAYPNDHTLFGYVNRTTDFKGISNRFGQKDGFKLINTFHIFQYSNQVNLLEFYKQKIHPKLPLIYRQDFLKESKKNKGFQLLFEFSSEEQLNRYNIIYEKIYNFVKDFNTVCYSSIKKMESKKSISLYEDGKQLNTYNINNLTQKQIANDLIQSINIDTLETIITLDDNNFHRVFGGSIQDQLLFIYNETSSNQQIQIAKNAFIHAAYHNRYQSLAYERILFILVNSQYFMKNFNQNIEQIYQSTNKDYLIYFTKTDYDRFQLKKYKFNIQNNKLNSSEILQFIQDVRLKKLDPQYKSQSIPTQQQQSSILRKIVGKTFISQIYQKPDQSILVLFIDSKDQSSYTHIKKLIQQFTIKYKKQIENKLVTAIFDLDKNEHKLLYLKQAPQLILFDRANKKQTKYIKFDENTNLQELSREIKRVVSNIEWLSTQDL